MTSRNFEKWFATFRENIVDYKFYVDFPKVYQNLDPVRVGLNILNALIGIDNIEDAFEKLLQEYPVILKCIPILLAKRLKSRTETLFVVGSDDKEYRFSFDKRNYEVSDYTTFMRETGLFDLIQNKRITNLVDYVTGVETGLDSHARKNRIGEIMRRKVEPFILQAGFKMGETCFKEMKTECIQCLWGLNFGGKRKKFDYVVKTQAKIYGIEINFYSANGSKPTEIIRSYTALDEHVQNVDGFEFVWITDGFGWKKSKEDFEGAFESIQHLYNLHDLENGILEKVFL